MTPVEVELLFPLEKIMHKKGKLFPKEESGARLNSIHKFNGWKIKPQRA